MIKKINKDNENFSAPKNGLTPPINGEKFSIKRGYKMRPSTIRKLLEIKAKHPDVNIYMSTVLDKIINYYYDECFLKEKR